MDDYSNILQYSGWEKKHKTDNQDIKNDFLCKNNTSKTHEIDCQIDINSESYIDFLNNEISSSYKQLTLFITKHIGTSAAQDILHDAVIVLILKLKDGKLRNKKAIKPFLYSTAKWLIRAYRTKDKAKISTYDHNMFEEFIDENNQSTDVILENQETQNELLSYISRMKKGRDKELLLLHYWYEKPEAFMEKYQVEKKHYSRLHYRAKQRLEKIIFNSRG